MRRPPLFPPKDVNDSAPHDIRLQSIAVQGCWPVRSEPRESAIVSQATDAAAEAARPGKPSWHGPCSRGSLDPRARTSVIRCPRTAATNRRGGSVDRKHSPALPADVDARLLQRTSRHENRDPRTQRPQVNDDYDAPEIAKSLPQYNRLRKVPDFARTRFLLHTFAVAGK